MIDFDIRPSGHPVPDAEREAILAAPGFGQVFTDHMITLRWSAERGWHDGRLEPYGPFTFDPATMVFHYAQEFFEGLKAYRQDERVHHLVPAGRQRGPVQPVGAPDGHARTARGDLRPGPGTAGRPGPRLGARGRGEQPVPAAVPDRDPARPRRQPPVERVPVLRHRLARRVVLRRNRRAQAGHGVAVRRSTPGPRPAAPARSSAAATTRPPSWPSSRPWRRAATRWSGWTPPSTAGSRKWAA